MRCHHRVGPGVLLIQLVVWLIGIEKLLGILVLNRDTRLDIIGSSLELILFVEKVRLPVSCFLTLSRPFTMVS